MSRKTVRELLDAKELQPLLLGKYDAGSAFLSVHAGAGGTDSCDWAEMLLRMYARFSGKCGWVVSQVSVQPGDEAGVRSATFHVDGKHVYGCLTGEAGVHRLVRRSSFDSAGRRHTSFAAVDVTPDVNQEEVKIDNKDLRIESFRSGGAGGQHVNTTNSARLPLHVRSRIMKLRKAESLLRPFCQSRKFNGLGKVYVYNGHAYSTDRVILATVPVDEKDSAELPSFYKKAQQFTESIDPRKCKTPVTKVEVELDAFFDSTAGTATVDHNCIVLDGCVYYRKYIAMIGKLPGAKRSRPNKRGDIMFVADGDIKGVLAGMAGTDGKILRVKV